MSDPSYMIYCQKEYDVFYHTVMTTTNTNTNTEENQPTKEHSQLIKLYDLDVYRTCSLLQYDSNLHRTLCVKHQTNVRPHEKITGLYGNFL